MFTWSTGPFDDTHPLCSFHLLMDVPSKCLQIKKDEVDVPLDHPEAFVLSNYPPKIQLHIFPKTAYPRTRCTCEIGVSGTSEDLQLTLIIVPSHPSSASHTDIIIHRGGSSFITISNSFVRVHYMPLLMYHTTFTWKKLFSTPQIHLSRADPALQHAVLQSQSLFFPNSQVQRSHSQTDLIQTHFYVHLYVMLLLLLCMIEWRVYRLCSIVLSFGVTAWIVGYCVFCKTFSL